MDPFYFLDLESTVKDNDDCHVDVYEIDNSMYPDGSWDITVDNEYSGYIEYNNDQFKIIEFNNSRKELACYHDYERTSRKIYKLRMTKISE